jgi:hypothetical protein
VSPEAAWAGESLLGRECSPAVILFFRRAVAGVSHETPGAVLLVLFPQDEANRKIRHRFLEIYAGVAAHRCFNLYPQLQFSRQPRGGFPA